MSGVFISYRRSDSAGYTGRLTDDIGEQLDGQALFRDIEAIEPGIDFVQALERAVAACSVMLVIIGPGWVGASGTDGRRRLHQPDDFVRMEVEAALAREIRVIPVLVGDAQMPEADDLPASMAGLLRRHAYAISDRRWQYDVAQLVDILTRVPGVSGRKSKAGVQARQGLPNGVKLAIALLLLLGVGLSARWLLSARSPTGETAATSAVLTDSAFYGDWATAEGEVYNINTEPDTGRLYVFAGSRMDDGTGGNADTPPPSAPGQDLYGNGTIVGGRLVATLVDLYSQEKYAVSFELSDDQTVLRGSVVKGKHGLGRELELRRRD